MNTTHYEISGDGLCEVTTERRRLVGMDAIMRDYSRNQPFSLPNAFKIMQLSVDMKVIGPAIFLSTTLPGISLNTWYIAKDGKLTPSFAPLKSDEPTLRMNWDAPDNMKLIFGVHGAIGNGVYTPSYVYLYAKSKDEPGFFKLPLPNIHQGSAHICMGGNFKVAAKTAQELFSETFMHFASSTWNRDLHNNPEECAKLFTFDQQTSRNVPVKNWTKLCGEKVNNATFANFTS